MYYTSNPGRLLEFICWSLFVTFPERLVFPVCCLQQRPQEYYSSVVLLSVFVTFADCQALTSVIVFPCQ